MKIPWGEFKSICDSRGLDMLMVEDAYTYFLYASENNFEIEAQVIKTEEDATDFASNYLANVNPKKTDIENSEVVRIKYCKLGWKYWCYSFEFETSKLGSMVSNRYSEACTATSYRFLDASRNELTTQQDIDSSCVITQVDWMPTVDIELIAGRIRQQTIPSQALYVFVQAAPDIPAIYGGNVDFVSNFNMQYLGATDELITDGRASKYIAYNDQVPANKLRFEFRHPAGFQHKMQCSMEFFRA